MATSQYEHLPKNTDYTDNSDDSENEISEDSKKSEQKKNKKIIKNYIVHFDVHKKHCTNHDTIDLFSKLKEKFKTHPEITNSEFITTLEKNSRSVTHLINSFEISECSHVSSEVDELGRRLFRFTFEIEYSAINGKTQTTRVDAVLCSIDNLSKQSDVFYKEMQKKDSRVRRVQEIQKAITDRNKTIDFLTSVIMRSPIEDTYKAFEKAGVMDSLKENIGISKENISKENLKKIGSQLTAFLERSIKQLNNEYNKICFLETDPDFQKKFIEIKRKNLSLFCENEQMKKELSIKNILK